MQHMTVIGSPYTAMISQTHIAYANIHYEIIVPKFFGIISLQLYWVQTPIPGDKIP